MELYIYEADSMIHLATIIGESNEECEAIASDKYPADDNIGWTYSPAFGMSDGLIENSDAETIEA
jgi:hypothetical protein